MFIENPSHHAGIQQINIPDGQTQKEGQKFMQFQLGQGNLALLPAQTVIEIRTLEASEILPVPQLPSCVLGMCQWRGEMLWIVDLEHLVGLSPLSWQRSNFYMVLQTEKKTLGLAVSQVTGVENYDLLQLHLPSPELFSPELLPFLQGFFLVEKQKLVRLLNPEAIVNFDPELRSF